MRSFDDQGSRDSHDLGPIVAESPLHEGQRLDQPTFHEIYSRMPEDFRAELIDGVVRLMNMPLSSDHARPDAGMIGILYFYAAETPGTFVLSNATTILGPRSEVQPDSVLLIDSAHGGRTGRDEKGYVTGGPELVVEIGFSTIRLDLDAKKRAYQEAGALEYVVFDVTRSRFHWFVLETGHFEPVFPDEESLYRSKVFPGLWVDEAAFVRGDSRAVIASLRRGLDGPEHAEFVERLRANRDRLAQG